MAMASSEDASARKAAEPEKQAAEVAVVAVASVARANAGEDEAAAASEQHDVGGDGDGEEDTVLLSEVLQHNEMMSEAADAVLGDCSDTNCSYPMGHMRQVSLRSTSAWKGL